MALNNESRYVAEERYFILCNTPTGWECTQVKGGLNIAEVVRDRMLGREGGSEVLIVEALSPANGSFAYIEPQLTEAVVGIAPAPIQIHLHLDGLTSGEIVRVVRELQTTGTDDTRQPTT